MMKELKITLFLLPIILQGCTETVYGGPSDKGALTEAQNHSLKLYSVNEGIVDLLTDLFFLDNCITDYGSNALDIELTPIYFPEAGISNSESSISIDRDRGIRLSVITGSASLKESGAKWVIDAEISKLWGDYVDEAFQFTVYNVSGSYSVEGRVMTNRLHETGYFYSDVNLTFTKDSVPIKFTDLSKPEDPIERDTPVFVFDGSLITFFGNDGKVDDSELKYDVEVSTLKGYDNKEYIGIDPIYDGTPYFQSGEITCLVHQNNHSDSRLIIRVKNERLWELEYNGEPESYRPNILPIRL